MARYTKGGDVVRVPQINAELEKIEQAFENTLSRDGDAPNQMNAPIDMNGNKIVNVQTDITDPNSLVQRSDLYVKSEVDAKDAQAVLDANAFAVNQDNAVLAAAQAYAEELAGEPVNTVRYVQEEVPIAPIISGARWYKPSEGVTYIYYVDGDSSQWVQETVNSFEGTLRDELADVNSDVLVGGVEAGVVGERYIDVKSFGVVGDNVTDDYTALVDAVNAAQAAGAYLHFPDNSIYNLNGNTLEMPNKVSGSALFTGDLSWTTVKEVSQKGQVRTTGTVRFSGVWYSQFDYIEASGNVTFDGAEPTWGTFWNQFNFLRCAELILDLDQGQSVNQNLFNTVRCTGLRIVGNNTTGIREAHNNMFMNLDTTGADMTALDGTTGVHVLNDSNSNQTNTIVNWYAEVSGRRLVKGNWMVMSANVDANNNPIMIDRNNSSLLCRNIGRLGNYLAASLNVARGGDWKELGATGLPLSMGTSLVNQVSLTDAPDGNAYGARQVGGATFRAINVAYPLTSNPTVNAVFFTREEGTPNTSVEIIDGAGASISSSVASRTPLGGGWYLLRVKGMGGVRNEGAGETTGLIRIFTTTGSALTTSDARTVSTYHITTEDTALLPHAHQGPKICYSTAPPTAGQWNVGDEVINTSPTAGGTYKWVCVTAGTAGVDAVFKSIGTIEA